MSSRARPWPEPRPRPPRRRRRRAPPPSSARSPASGPSDGRLTSSPGAGRVSPILGRRTVARSPASADGRPSARRSGRSGRASSEAAGRPRLAEAALMGGAGAAAGGAVGPFGPPGPAPGALPAASTGPAPPERPPPRPPRDPRRRGRDACPSPSPGASPAPWEDALSRVGDLVGADLVGVASAAALVAAGGPGWAVGAGAALPGSAGGVAMGSVMGVFPSSGARSMACCAPVAGGGTEVSPRAVAPDLRLCCGVVRGFRVLERSRGFEGPSQAPGLRPRLVPEQRCQGQKWPDS
jgi:hypothetical protein